MKGLTEYGKYLRKLRVDSNETMKDMAEKFGVTVSYLSAVELGKREIPSSWNSKLFDNYQLDKVKISELNSSYATTINEIKFNLQGYDTYERKLVASFARQLDLFKLEDFKELESLLNKKGDD